MTEDSKDCQVVEDGGGGEGVRKVVSVEGVFCERKNRGTNEVIERVYLLKRFDEEAKREIERTCEQLGWNLEGLKWEEGK